MIASTRRLPVGGGMTVLDRLDLPASDIDPGLPGCFQDAVGRTHQDRRDQVGGNPLADRLQCPGLDRVNDGGA